MKTLKFALLGVGRIGKVHARNIYLNPKSSLCYVYDIDTKIAEEIANKYGAKIAKSATEAISSKEVDAVFICTATPTHIDYLKLAAKEGKSILCEKPIDLDISKVNNCKKELKNFDVPIQIGFHRRFDPNHCSIKEKKDSGEIGNLEKIIITSRDPSGPSADYLKVSGGMFRDMTIHDFDIVSFILNDDPIEKIFAIGENLFSNDVKEANDIDTAMIIMKSKSGVLCHINNSRHASYGHDQRIELFGSKGMLISENLTPTSVETFNSKSTGAKGPILDFFIERYEAAYKKELDSFIDCINNKKSINVSFEDGRKALIVANAAYESFSSGKLITINYD